MTEKEQTMLKLDANTTLGSRVIQRLKEDQVIWLTTVRPDGSPQPNPVWFLWDGETLVIYSQPTARKVSHIQKNPHVALNFNSTPDGSDVVIITGDATIEPNPTSVTGNETYLEKYRQGIADIGLSPESMAQSFSTVIRVTPRHARGM
jgi:PPOX class probable F420-dependent enzyme